MSLLVLCQQRQWACMFFAKVFTFVDCHSTWVKCRPNILKHLKPATKHFSSWPDSLPKDNWISGLQWWNRRQLTYTGSTSNHKREAQEQWEPWFGSRRLKLCFFVCCCFVRADQQVASSAETVKRTSTCGNHKRAGPRGKSTNGLSVPTASRWRTCSGRPPRPRYVTQGRSRHASESHWNGQNLQRHLAHYFLPLLPKLCSSHL